MCHLSNNRGILHRLVYKSLTYIFKMGNELGHPDLELPPDKHVLVTGGNTGIGYETAKSLAQMGAQVYIACRSEDKAKAAIERMQNEHRDEMQQKKQAESPTEEDRADIDIKPLIVNYIKLDLASLQSTMDFIEEIKQRLSSLNILVCNAGIAFVKQGYTCDNLECHFQVNYLSHLLITLHLVQLLRAGAPDSRIVFLSSKVHSSGKLDLNNMQCQKSYSRMGAYACSKAYMVMAAYFLARRLEGTNIYTYAVDPGMVDTEIKQNFSDWKVFSFMAAAAGKLGIMRSPREGAATSVVACVDPELSGKTAVFLKNCQTATCASFCRDEAKQEMLWQYSLACLNKFVSDDVLKESFPSANPDLLTISKDTKMAEEEIKEGNLDDKQLKQNPEGKATLEREDACATVSDVTPGMPEKSEGKASVEKESASATVSDVTPGMPEKTEGKASLEKEGAPVTASDENPKLSQETEMNEAPLECKEAATIVSDELPKATDAGKEEGRGEASAEKKAALSEDAVD